MNEIGKILLLIGAVCILAGLLFMTVGKLPGIGKLPGDILVKKENFTFYFPVTTSIVISLVLSLLFYFWGRR